MPFTRSKAYVTLTEAVDCLTDDDAEPADIVILPPTDGDESELEFGDDDIIEDVNFPVDVCGESCMRCYL